MDVHDQIWGGSNVTGCRMIQTWRSELSAYAGEEDVLLCDTLCSTFKDKDGCLRGKLCPRSILATSTDEGRGKNQTKIWSEPLST